MALWALETGTGGRQAERHAGAIMPHTHNWLLKTVYLLVGLLLHIAAVPSSSAGSSLF